MGVFDLGSTEQRDMQYMGEVDAAMHMRGHPWAFTLSLSTLLFFVAFFIWASSAMIDDVTRGNGQVVPAQGVQPIQSEKGGIITEIFVKENQQVERNEKLVSIAGVTEETTLADLQNRRVELTLNIVRLDAEEKGTAPSFTPEQTADSPESVAAQERLFTTGKQQFESQVQVLNFQFEQRRREVGEARERKQAVEGALLVLRQEEATVRPLVGRSYSQIQYLDLKGRINAQEGELASLVQTIARTESAARAAEERLKNLRNERQAKIADEQNKNRVELAAVEQQITASTQHVTSTDLRSPVRGTVKRIILKKDSVAKGAEPILEILPTDGVLEVEARFSPQDRGFLFVNQEAMVKVSSYEFSIYGGLEATIIKISQDTIEDKKGQPWYEVRFLTKRKSILYRGEELPILPGMTVSVDVLTDKKSVLSHIVGPIKRAMQNAMTEH